LTCVTQLAMMTHMTKTQVYMRRDELKSLHRIAEATGSSVAELVRDAVRRVWLRPEGAGPVGLWSGPVRRTSLDHDSIYDEP
jgi:hypothetical protein